jgi:hypothetical protein
MTWTCRTCRAIGADAAITQPPTWIILDESCGRAHGFVSDKAQTEPDPPASNGAEGEEGEEGEEGMRELLSQSLFFEISALLVLAAAVGFIGHLLASALIVSFIAVGIIAGPSALDIDAPARRSRFCRSWALPFLLFLVGLKLDVKLIGHSARCP